MTYEMLQYNIYVLKLSQLISNREQETKKMARGLGVLADAGILLGSSSGLLLLGKIIMSILVISMVIFACGDNKACDFQYITNLRRIAIVVVEIVVYCVES